MGRARGKNLEPRSLLLRYLKVWVGRPTFDKRHSGKSLLKSKQMQIHRAQTEAGKGDAGRGGEACRFLGTWGHT